MSNIDGLAPILEFLTEPNKQNVRQASQALETLNKTGIPLLDEGTILARVQQFIESAGKTDLVLDPSEALELKERCVQTKMQIVVASMLREDGAEFALDAVESVHDLRERYGGTVSASLRNATVILLAAGTESSLSRALMEIYDDVGTNTNWVVDFSALQKLSWMFLGSIVSYAERLNAAGRKIWFTWLDRNLVPESEAPRFAKFFNLKQIGSHYFSKVE